MNEKLLALTGKPDKPDNKAMEMPLQEKFEQLNKRNTELIKKPLELDKMRPFHLSELSKIK